jgi:NAD(P)H dehydrogenase (quinone)
MYAHVYKLAEAVAEGAREVEGAKVSLYQVAELVPDEALARTGAKKAREAFAHIPVAKPSQLAEADCILFGTPTRFGNMCAQMRNFLKSGQGDGALVGKVAGGSRQRRRNGGRETTITSFHKRRCTWDGDCRVPYAEQRLTQMGESWGSPYGAATMAGCDRGSRQKSAGYQGRHQSGVAWNWCGVGSIHFAIVATRKASAVRKR